MKPYLRSGELARLAGISPDTLRHYERTGVLQPPRRSPANYRLYPPESVERVRLIRHSLSVGFSLAELTKILRVRDQGGFPCRHVKTLLEDKLGQLDREIAEMKELRAHLKSLLDNWRERLRQTPDGHPARLLESIPSMEKPNENTRTRFTGRRNARKRA